MFVAMYEGGLSQKSLEVRPSLTEVVNSYNFWISYVYKVVPEKKKAMFIGLDSPHKN